MKIEKIIKLKNGKYKIKFDEIDLITYDEVILKYNLLNELLINKHLLNKIKLETKYYDEYFKTLKYLNIRLRSEHEIKKYLNKKNSSNISKIISELKKNNLINDNTFVKAFIKDKFNLSNYGPYKIKQELLKHKIDESKIEEYLTIINSEEIEEKLEKGIKKRIKNNKYSKFVLKQKIINEFTLKGFERDMIIKLFEKHYVIDEKIISKEYDKLKTTCLNTIYRKLYQKGFLKEEIENIIIKKRV